MYQEEQPQYVEQQPVQYVDPNAVQYVPVTHDPTQEQLYVQEHPVEAQVQQPVVVKSAPPQHYYEAPVQQYAPQPVKYVKAAQPTTYEASYQPPEEGYYDDIEPTETDIGDGADLDEGTVTAQQQHFREPAPVITGDRLAQKDNVKPKVVKANYQQARKTVKQANTSPRITAMPTSKSIDQRANTIQAKKATASLTNQMAALDPFDDDQEFSHDDWKNIQKKIDKQYEQKLKEVGDDALKKLKMFQAEHKALLEKTQYLIDHSRIEDEEDEFLPQGYVQKPAPQTERKSINTDRNRFFTPAVQEQLAQDEYEYKRPTQLKNSAKGPGPQVIRKSQQQIPVVQSAPQQKRYVEQQPVQQVKQFAQQPVYQPQPVVHQQPQQ